MMENIPPIDLKDALERTGDDMDFLLELLEMYEKDFRAKAATLETALAGFDFEALREIGHYLKGSSANLSLGPLREAAFMLERAGTEKDPEGAIEGMARLKRGFEDLERYLQESPERG